MQKTSSEEPAAAGAGQTMMALGGPAMGTHWAARCQAGSQATDWRQLEQDLASAVHCVDAQMSPWKADSDLMRLNRAAIGQWVDLPPEILEVMACGLEVGRRSGGAFDMAAGSLVNAWGFGAVRDAPNPQAIRAATAAFCSAQDGLELDGPGGRARKLAPMCLDLCGIAKGYAVDQMAQVVRAHGIAHALVSLDGELCACGARADGHPWAVALESPQEGVRAVHGVIELADLAVATSGDYRHSVQVGPVRIAHSMDTRRSAPVNNDVASVTVLAPYCMRADAWATALLVSGAQQGAVLAQSVGLDALFLLRRGDQLVEWGLGRFASASA